MSDGNYRLPIFEEDITSLEQYWMIKQIEEEYYYEEILKDEKEN